MVLLVCALLSLSEVVKGKKVVQTQVSYCHNSKSCRQRSLHIMASNFHTKMHFPRVGNLNTEDNFVADHAVYAIAVSDIKLSLPQTGAGNKAAC